MSAEILVVEDERAIGIAIEQLLEESGHVVKVVGSGEDALVALGHGVYDVVVTDNYNFETTGEIGLASGNATLKQPGEICPGLVASCITAAQDDIRARAWFTDDASTTNYLTSGNFYNPQASANSDVPLPFMDATHSARVGAKVTFPAGKPAVIGYGAKKWYLYPQRSVVAQTEIEHADLALSYLLETIIEKLCTTFTIAKLEGDAVFAYVEESKLEDGKVLLELLDQTYLAFRDKASALYSQARRGSFTWFRVSWTSRTLPARRAGAVTRCLK